MNYRFRVPVKHLKPAHKYWRLESSPPHELRTNNKSTSKHGQTARTLPAGCRDSEPANRLP
jgi:hypothetical protein